MPCSYYKTKELNINVYVYWVRNHLLHHLLFSFSFSLLYTTDILRPVKKCGQQVLEKSYILEELTTEGDKIPKSNYMEIYIAIFSLYIR